MVDAFEWRFALPTTHKQEVVAVGRDGSCETERHLLPQLCGDQSSGAGSPNT